jgi:hypothetical protein
MIGFVQKAQLIDGFLIHNIVNEFNGQEAA